MIIQYGHPAQAQSYFGIGVLLLFEGDAGLAAALAPGLEFTATGRIHWTIDTDLLPYTTLGRLRWTIDVGLTHYTALGRTHFTIDEEDA